LPTLAYRQAGAVGFLLTHPLAGVDFIFVDKFLDNIYQK